MAGQPYTPTPRVAADDPALPQGDPENLALAHALLDARRYLRGSAWGALEGEDRVVVGGTAGAPTLDVGVVEAAAVRSDNGTWYPAFAAAQTVAPAVVASAQRRYLYLRAADDGTISYVVSAEAPTGLYRATGGELQRHVCSFQTAADGTPLAAVERQHSGRYVTSSGQAELTALAAGRATSWTAVDLAGLVPPAARFAWVYARVYKAAADLAVREVRVRRSSADAAHLVAAAVLPVDAAAAPIDSYNENLVLVPLLAQAFEYQLSAAVTNSDPYGARFLVAGWE